MRKIVLTYGLIAGGILAGLMSITLPFHEQLGVGMEAGMVIGYTTMLLAFLMVYFGVRNYRDNVAGGTISFGRAFGIGMLIAFIGATCYVAAWHVIYQNFMPDYMDKYAATALAKSRAEGKPEAEIAKEQQEMAEFAESYKNPLVRTAWTYLEPLPVALLVSLVSAGVLSRKRRVAGQVPA